MSTTPPEHGTPTGRGMGPGMPGIWGGARMPVPGNAEFAFLFIAIVALAVIALIANTYNTLNWVHSFEWLGAAYLLSRGIAKASRVLEH
jgi:hypothetical protein